MALSQAARYIHETQTSYDSFLKLYDIRAKALLRQNPGKREYQNESIRAALQLSFDALKARDPNAAALLVFFGYFDSNDIFKELFTDLIQSPKECYPLPPPLCFNEIGELPSEWLRSLGAKGTKYEDAVRSLLAFSFVNHDMASESLSIHPIVHEWALSISHDVCRVSCLPTVVNNVANTHCTVWRDGLLHTQEVRDILSRMRPHIDRCMTLAKPDCCQAGIIPEDLVLMGTYYVSIFRFISAASRLDALREACVTALDLLKENHTDSEFSPDVSI